MKKVFTLFALLLTIVIGAKANYEPTADEVIILNNVYSATATSTGYSTHSAIAWGGTASTNSKKAGDPNNGGAATSSNVNCYSVKNNGNAKAIDVKFTGCSGIIVYHESHNSRYLLLKQNNSTTIATGSAATYYTEVTGLDANTEYSIRLQGTGTGSDQQDLYVYAVKLIKGSAKTVTAVSLDGVKIDGTLATENTDYTISGTTITLSQSYAVAPEVALVQKTTYDDNSSTTSDIDVTLTKGEAYFTGTATIGAGTDYETEYTVQVPVSTAATLEADVTALSVSSPKVATGTAKFNVVGANLTGSTVTLAFASAVDGLTVSPASIEVTEGAVNQEVTISYYSAEDVAEANVNLTISSDEVDDVVIPVTYSSTAGIADVTPISGATTWDWSTAASANIVSTDPNNVVVFANADGWNASFNAEAIAGKANNFYASKSAYKYCQGSILKFHTSVPGTVSIDFSNTGSKTEYRWLAVNGAVTAYKSKDESKVEAVNISVPAGDVVIEAIMGTSAETAPEYTEANTMLNFRKIVFTDKEPSNLAASDGDVEVNKEETTEVTYTTSSTGAVSVETSDATVATATVDQVNKTITISGVKAGEATITVTQAEDASYSAGSLTIGVTVNNPDLKTVYDVTGLSYNEFVLSKDNIGGQYGENDDNQFVTVATDNITQSITDGGYSGTFYNMSKPERQLTFKVKGAENFKVLVRNTTADRQYTVKVGDAAAQTVVHGGDKFEFSPVFETGTTDEVTITLAGVDNKSVYPVAIVFNVAEEVTVNVGETGFATIGLPYATTLPSGVKAYKVTAAQGTTVTVEEVTETSISENTGLIITATPGDYTFTQIAGGDEVSDNLLLATGSAAYEAASAGEFYYFAVINATQKKVGFKKIADGGSVGANKAILPAFNGGGNTLTLQFAGDATAINGIEAEADAVAPVKVIKNGQLFIGNFNVAGQQVK